MAISQSQRLHHLPKEVGEGNVHEKRGKYSLRLKNIVPVSRIYLDKYVVFGATSQSNNYATCSKLMFELESQAGQFIKKILYLNQV